MTTKEIIAQVSPNDRPVAYWSALAGVVGGATPALLLSLFCQRSDTEAETVGTAPDNSFYMTQGEITEQTGLTRRETETARKYLRDAGVLIEEKRGATMKIWFRVDGVRLLALLKQQKAAKGE